MEDIKSEDRLREYNFNVDGKWHKLQASDREIVKIMRLHHALVEALKDAITDHGFEYDLVGDSKQWQTLVDEAEGK